MTIVFIWKLTSVRDITSPISLLVVVQGAHENILEGRSISNSSDTCPQFWITRLRETPVITPSGERKRSTGRLETE